MSVGRSGVLERLYHVDHRPEITRGSVLLSAPDGFKEDARLAWLEADLRAVLSCSGFHVSRVPRPGLIAELVIGDGPKRSDAPTLAVDYDGWRFKVGGTLGGTRRSADDPNGITSLLASGIAASEVFRIRFREESVWQPSEGLEGSICAAPGGEGSVPTELDFGADRVALLGCGSISFGLAWALRGGPKIRGTLDVVDPSALNPSNRRKYLALRGDERNVSKAVALARIFGQAGIQCKPHVCSANEYARSTEFRMPFAITAMDSSIARRDVQAKLPKLVVNAWTAGSSEMLLAGTSRHTFDGNEDCLNCAYWSDTEGALTDLAEVAGRLGTDPRSLLRCRREGLPFPKLKASRFDAGPRFVDGYFNACEQMSIRRGHVERNFSVPFIAAVGGALLAFALVCEGSPSFRRFQLHGLRRWFGMAPAFSSLYDEPAAAKDGCICRDATYRRGFEAKWAR